jgi:DNA mismatch repair protein MutS
LPLFSTEPHPVVKEVRQLKIDEMSPLEAINKLYQLQRRAGEEE